MEVAIYYLDIRSTNIKNIGKTIWNIDNKSGGYIRSGSTIWESVAMSLLLRFHQSIQNEHID